MPQRKPYPTQRYGQAHRAMRARLAPLVARGTVACARCGQLIGSDEKWELDHRDDGHGWLGPSHQRCKCASRLGGDGRSEQWPRVQRGARPVVAPWDNDPRVGTEVLLGDGLVEVHVGRGIWQTVAV